jgi:hypothetical protein
VSILASYFPDTYQNKVHQSNQQNVQKPSVMVEQPIIQQNQQVQYGQQFDPNNPNGIQIQQQFQPQYNPNITNIPYVQQNQPPQQFNPNFQSEEQFNPFTQGNY